jgi:hypothetical protein
MTTAPSPRPAREFLRFFIFVGLVAGLIVCGRNIYAQIQRSQAEKDYSALQERLSDTLRVGRSKPEVLSSLQSKGIAYVDWAQPDVEPDGFSPEVVITVRKWAGPLFSEELYLSLNFQRGALSGWGPWYQGGK